MIDYTREKRALYLLQMILCRTRSLVLLGEPSDKIAKVLDWAELLPFYLRSDHDQTAEFDEVLSAIAAEFPDWTVLFSSTNHPQLS